MCVFVQNEKKNHGSFIFIFFYDDIMPQWDICVMAVSRLQEESEVTVCQLFYGETLTYNEGELERQAARGREKEESMSEALGEDNILPLYGVTGRCMAAFLTCHPTQPSCLSSNRVNLGWRQSWQHFMKPWLTLSSSKCTIAQLE